MVFLQLERKIIPQLESDQRPGQYAVINCDAKVEILKALDEWQSTRVLLVNSKSLAAQTEHIANLKAGLGDRLVSHKEGVGAHSPYPDVIDIAHRITQHNVDTIVVVGSGSYSDAAKAARLLQANLPPKFGEAEMEAIINQAHGINSADRFQKPSVKLILVPTTLSAGEWNYAASCTNSHGKKQHYSLKDGGAANLILVDPWLAMTSPERLWLSSGVRAIDHCVETLCNSQAEGHPDAQEWCIQALKDLCKGLAEYKQGLYARDDVFVHGISKCQAGSRMALMSFMVYQIPMGPSHAIGHQLGSVAGVMHGITSCIMLPPVLRFTKDKTQVQQARIVEAFNQGMDWQETEAADCVARLVKLLDLPSTLEEVGVTETEQIETIIDKTMTDVLFAFGLVTSREDIAKIVYSAKTS